MSANWRRAHAYREHCPTARRHSTALVNSSCSRVTLLACSRVTLLGRYRGPTCRLRLLHHSHFDGCYIRLPNAFVFNPQSPIRILTFSIGTKSLFATKVGHKDSHVRAGRLCSVNRAQLPLLESPTRPTRIAYVSTSLGGSGDTYLNDTAFIAASGGRGTPERPARRSGGSGSGGRTAQKRAQARRGSGRGSPWPAASSTSE